MTAGKRRSSVIVWAHASGSGSSGTGTIAQKYDGSAHRTPGRPLTPTEISDLVIRMAEENSSAMDCNALSTPDKSPSLVNV